MYSPSSRRAGGARDVFGRGLRFDASEMGDDSGLVCVTGSLLGDDSGLRLCAYFIACPS